MIDEYEAPRLPPRDTLNTEIQPAQAPPVPRNPFRNQPYRMPGLTARPSMSASRRRKLLFRKVSKAASVITVTCALCGTPIRATVRPLAQARLTEHYQRHHAHVLRYGGIPLLEPEP